MLVELLMHHRPARLVVDLSAATSIESTVLGMLSAASDIAHDMGTALAVCGGGAALD
jgi:anti-anti-sigma regulatory factor